MKLRWKGRAAGRALSAVLAALAKDWRTTPEVLALQQAGVRVVLGPPLILGNPGADGVTSWPRRLDLDCDDAALRQWKAKLPPAVLAEAAPVLPAKRRVHRDHKLGIRVSETAASKLKGFASRSGVSESEALDSLLRALP